jgi:predicted enzyme related to lactoylglutathione lyase
MDVKNTEMPDEIPAHWLVYFAVEDTDATVAKAEETGGTLRFGPIDIPIGRFAVMTDPNGSAFAVIALKQAG